MAPHDHRQDRPGEPHPKADPERQRQHQKRRRGHDAKQTEYDDEGDADGHGPTSPQTASHPRPEWREDPHAQDGDGTERADHAVGDPEVALDGRLERPDRDDLGPQHEGHADQGDERGGERPPIRALALHLADCVE